ncbi:hypothetical protein PTKIN_Ptkin06aG0122000 [Pterospermum kingtungense]
MASHLIKSSFTTSPLSRALLVSPKALSTSLLRMLPTSTRQSSFTIRAVQPEKPPNSFSLGKHVLEVKLANLPSDSAYQWDPFIGSLETPITSSPLIAWYLSNLLAYRTAVSPLLRGVEVGLAHGFLLVGPFVKAGPLRNTSVAGGAGSLAVAGLVVILSICLTMYGVASFKEEDPSTAPSLTLTGRKKVSDQLQTADGWASFTGGFFFGGISSVIWAYFLLYVLNLPYFFK